MSSPWGALKEKEENCCGFDDSFVGFEIKSRPNIVDGSKYLNSLGYF